MPSVFDDTLEKGAEMESPPAGIPEPLNNHVGARVARDFASGPGLNVERSKAHKTAASKTVNKNLWGKGKPKLSDLHGAATCHVSDVTEVSKCDQKEYAGEVSVKFHERFNHLNAIGVNIAKCVDKGGEEGGTVVVPGRIVAQKHLKGRTTGVTYRAVYLNGEEENLNETMLRYYSSVFASASMRPENPIRPLRVVMM